MPPPTPPRRNHHGQLLNAMGQVIDNFDRRLDGFNRPMTQRILRATVDRCHRSQDGQIQSISRTSGGNETSERGP